MVDLVAVVLSWRPHSAADWGCAMLVLSNTRSWRPLPFTAPGTLTLTSYIYTYSLLRQGGARCSSVVRAFTHGVMSRRIDPSWGGPIEIFLVPASAPRLVDPLSYFSFQPVLHDWCNKGCVVCAILYVG